MPSTAKSEPRPAFDDDRATEPEARGPERMSAALTATDAGELRRRDAWYRAVVNASPDAILVVDPSGAIVFASPRARTFFGYGANEPLEGGRVADTILSRGDTNARARLAEALGVEDCDPHEYLLRRKDGSLFPASVITSWIQSRPGEREGTVLIIRDLTEQRQREATLRSSEARFSTIFRANPIATTLTRADDDGHIVDVNDAFLEMSGLTRDVIGKSAIGLGLFADRDARRTVINRVRIEGRVQTLEAHVPWKSGRIRDVIVSFDLVEIDGEEFVLGMWRDVTERHEAERELRSSELRFREVVEAIAEVFWVVDEPTGRITYVSPSFEQIWGLPAEGLLASSDVWMQSVHPEDRERMRAMAAKQAETGYNEVYRIVRPDGAVRWIRDRAFPVRGDDGSVRRVVGVAADITEKKELELQFLHAQRLEAVGTLASGMAHEMNNVLAPFMVIPDLLKQSCSSPADHELLGMLETTARRGAGIMKQLLAFSRAADSERVALSIDALMKDLLGMLRATFPREITVQWERPPRLPTVTANPTQLHQVLINLCVNARDAMPGEGVITLKAMEVELGEEAVRPHPGAAAGRYVVISVGDTGKGIPPENMGQLFTPFFTTKDTGAGTGLGLSTASSIAKSHGGFITVSSEVGKGSVFQVHLPATPHHGPAPVAVPSENVAAGRGELILIVDDEEPVRTTLRQLLEKQGYQVIVAVDGREARDVLVQGRDSIRLLITDLMMPNVNGAALISDVRRIAPTVPILAITGAIENKVLEHLKASGVCEILPKPFGPVAIIDLVRRCLERAAVTAGG